MQTIIVRIIGIYKSMKRAVIALVDLMTVLQVDEVIAT